MLAARSWILLDSPTKSFVVENHAQPDVQPLFQLAFGKFTEFELYQVTNDPYCLINLYGKEENKEVEEELKRELIKELTRSRDSRIVRPDKEVFESYPRYDHMREFPVAEHKKDDR